MHARILVICCCTGECSTAVAALIALISPLPYSADFRPYFTIHDPDFRAMTTPDPAPTHTNLPRLLGVTNRYFLKVGACPYYAPHHILSPCFCECLSYPIASRPLGRVPRPKALVGSSAHERFASKAALSFHASNQASLKCMYEVLWIHPVKLLALRWDKLKHRPKWTAPSALHFSA